MSGDLGVYLLIVVVMSITPGPDVALVIRAASIGGVRAAIPVLGGITTGLFAHMLCSIIGVSAVIATTPAALDALRIAGAAWLAWLGMGALRDGALRSVPTPRSANGSAEARAPGFRIGVVTNLLNAKILLFYLAFLPQFAPAGDGFAAVALVLGLVQIAIGLLWLSLCSVLASRMRDLLQPGRPTRRWVDAVTGAVILVAAIELLWSALR